MPDEKKLEVLEYRRAEGVQRKRAIIAAFLIGTVLLAYFAIQSFSNRRRNQWQKVQWPHSTNDFYGNIALIDDDNDAVSILATNFAGWGYSASFTTDKFVVGVGEPLKTVVITNRKRTLVVVLPDGSEQQFPLPKGFAKQLHDGFHRSDDSLLRSSLALYGPGDNRTRLEKFLAQHKEPESLLKRPTTATSQP